MNAIQIAAKLYECRDAARRLLGDHFDRDMALYAKAIRGIAATKGCTELSAAQGMAKECGGFGAIAILAAFVEMTEAEEIAPATNPAHREASEGSMREQSPDRPQKC